MPIRKRGDVYYIDLYTPSGERIRRTIKTTVKKEAQQYHDQLKAQLWQIDKLDQKPEYLFENALVLFLKDAEGKEDTATKKRHAIYFRDIFAGRTLSSLTSDEILDAIPEKHMTKGTPLTNATKNKYRTSIMRILKLAYQSGYIEKMPYIPKKKEPPIRVRWITKEQAKQLIDRISTDWMKTICAFALLTGARRTEILSMTWDKIDFIRKVAIVSNDIAKSEKARSLLLNDDAIELLQKQKGKNPKYVFVGDKGQSLQDINRKTFNKATEKCFLADFHFHDLRHTWASWHVQAGTPLFTLKELGGWETLEMVKKYAHLNADHLLSHANSVKF
ncbi:integrase [Pasteurellaceae bacterium 15-036681]|nr:integrase [Pasteurellaceae bacterium 15-036681]